MRLCNVLLVAVATFLASSGAISTTVNQADSAHHQRHVRSYGMKDLEREDEERFQANGIGRIAQRTHVESPTINVSAMLRTYTKEFELQRITSFFEAHDGALGGWLQRSVLDGLRGPDLVHKRQVFAQWHAQGRTAENVKALLSANSFVDKEYGFLSEMYAGFLARLS